MDVVYHKILKSVNFARSYSKNKKGAFLRHVVLLLFLVYVLPVF